jgi:hypothetical protein
VNAVDLLIVYLALGAPFAVYKFFQFSEADKGRRLLLSVATLLFWIPPAIGIVYRHLSNAYSEPDFVSSDGLDARDARLVELATKVKAKLRSTSRSIPAVDPREVVERYVGLATLAGMPAATERDWNSDLMRAAGREDDPIAAACLIRRNQRGIGRHHKKARLDYFEMFESFAELDPAAAQEAVQLGIQLANALGDTKAVDGLVAIAEQIKDEVCAPNDHRPVLSNISPRVTALTITTARSNND